MCHPLIVVLSIRIFISCLIICAVLDAPSCLFSHSLAILLSVFPNSKLVSLYYHPPIIMVIIQYHHSIIQHHLHFFFPHHNSLVSYHFPSPWFYISSLASCFAIILMLKVFWTRVCFSLFFKILFYQIIHSISKVRLLCKY